MELLVRSTLPGHQKVFLIEKLLLLETHSFCANTGPMFNKMLFTQYLKYEYLSTEHEIWLESQWSPS